ncbi:Eukaryotic translation initiation factor 3 subunit L [Venturia nashicola]|uniref:Eukaryotic translation initiation factor 3 subunit L n=1 Tax=Venturia nashicola TaxID=86259 RepID=A0A4Z1P742_9PEZI|nr:Eukaryotic translation initiation factor 3 subunit L [Venturia nashicola]TLD37249.1 Eukaryotic translation initiation factor 3 subunit L [Venturia nashicola]
MTHPPPKKSDPPTTKPARIIPAIPLSFPRQPRNEKTLDEPKQPARAVTPDASVKSADSPRNNALQHDSSASHPTSSIQEPMTPDSLTSTVAKASINGDSEIPRGKTHGHEQKGAGIGNTGYHQVSATGSAFKTDRGYVNGSHGLKHENAANGNGSVRTEHLGAQSRDFVPLKVPAKLPPPFYPQQPPATPDSSYTSKPYTVVEEDPVLAKENLRGLLPQVQTDSAVLYAAPIDVVADGGEVTLAESSNLQVLRAGAAAYPPFQGYAGEPFPPPPGLPHPALGQAFNPQAHAFQFGSQMPNQSQASHELQSSTYSNHMNHAGPVMMPDTSGLALDNQAAAALKGFFEFQFGSPNFSDVTLNITERGRSTEPVVLQAHRIVLARSPKLRELMMLDTDVVDIDLEAKYLETNSFINVLRYLYGAALPARNSLAGQPMEQCLALAAAGWHCGLSDVTIHGLECAESYLNWDNLEEALNFALDGGLTPVFQFNEAEIVAIPSFGEFAGQFLHNILKWISLNLPTNFQFTASAPQLMNSPRLPSILEGRPSVANPRLSRIQFGDLPSEESSLPTTLLSSIMVSLPLGALRHLLLHPAFWVRAGHTEMVRAVIKERESRREKVLESKRYLPGATPYMRETMYWKEELVNVDGHAQAISFARLCLKAATGEGGENMKKEFGEEC